MIRFLIFELILLFCSYYGLYFFKTSSFIPQGIYLSLLPLYIFLWVFLSLYYKKYKHVHTFNFRTYFRTLVFSSSCTLFFLVLVVSLTGLAKISRLFLIGIVVVPSMLELAVVCFIKQWLHISGKLEKDKNGTSGDTEKMTHKLTWLVNGFILFIISFLIMIRLKSGSFEYYQWSEEILMILLGSWAFSFGVTSKYKLHQSQNLYYKMAPFIIISTIKFQVLQNITPFAVIRSEREILVEKKPLIL